MRGVVVCMVRRMHVMRRMNRTPRVHRMPRMHGMSRMCTRRSVSGRSPACVMVCSRFSRRTAGRRMMHTWRSVSGRSPACVTVCFRFSRRTACRRMMRTRRSVSGRSPACVMVCSRFSGGTAERRRSGASVGICGDAVLPAKIGGFEAVRMIVRCGRSSGNGRRSSRRAVGGSGGRTHFRRTAQVGRIGSPNIAFRDRIASRSVRHR